MTLESEQLHELLTYQRRYFEILEEFFLSITGKSAKEFASLDGFSEAARRIPAEMNGNVSRERTVKEAYPKFEKCLRELYSKEGGAAFKAAKNLKTCKLNIGGSSRFLGTQLNATRRSLLFADTVLIPDPILPWIEVDRSEEKFRHVEPIQNCFFLLHLSDLLSDDYETPPIVVFPSWEKSLENTDAQTIANSETLFAELFRFYVDDGIHCFEDVLEYGDKHPQAFIRAIEKSNLFVAPGDDIGLDVASSLTSYRAYIREHRTAEWYENLATLPDTRQITNAIWERVQSQFHLLENSDELNSHPFLCIEAQAHYYKLVARMKNERAVGLGNHDSSTQAILASLVSKRMDFLANLKDAEIVELRKTDQNAEFRQSLRSLVSSLSDAVITNEGQAVAEICGFVESEISKQERAMSALQEKYSAKHKYTALMGAGTLSVTMFPVLTPFVAALPIGLASVTAKYGMDKLEERSEKRTHARSMMGVLSVARKISRA